MGLFDKFFGKRNKQSGPSSEHAVLVYFEYGSTDLSLLFACEEELEKVIDAASAGEFDGNEIAADGTDGILFMYGPDADSLFNAVRPTLEATSFLSGAKVVLRYGPPKDGIKETEIVLGT